MEKSGANAYEQEREARLQANRQKLIVSRLGGNGGSGASGVRTKRKNSFSPISLSLSNARPRRD